MSAGTTTHIQSLMSLFPIFNQPLATSEVSLTALKGVVKKKKKKEEESLWHRRTAAHTHHSTAFNRTGSNRFTGWKQHVCLDFSDLRVLKYACVSNIQYVWIQFPPGSWTLCFCSVPLSGGCRVSGPVYQARSEMSWVIVARWNMDLELELVRVNSTRSL